MYSQTCPYYIHVSVRLIYTHNRNGTTTDCPDYRGVLISQVRLYTFISQWDHN